MGPLPAPMTSSPLFLSYGMPKSGSTLAFELTRTMLELAGVPQDKLGGGVVSATADVNFVLELDGESFKQLKEQTRSLATPLAIKTHSKLFPRVRNALASGAVIGHAVCRDPRDIALSMLDAAREGRAWGTGPDGPFRTVADTEKRLRASIRHFLAWAETPNVMPIHYERLAFDTAAVAAEIAAQLGITADLGPCDPHRHAGKVHPTQPGNLAALEIPDGSIRRTPAGKGIRGFHRQVLCGCPARPATRQAETPVFHGLVQARLDGRPSARFWLWKVKPAAKLYH